MIPGMNPRDMQKAMKRLGIQQEEVDAQEVVIRTGDKELVVSNPQVTKINMGGQETFQIMGSVEERAVSSEAEINEEDVKTVMEQANVDEEKAKEAIKNNDGDLAKAVMELKQ